MLTKSRTNHMNLVFYMSRASQDDIPCHKMLFRLRTFYRFDEKLKKVYDHFTRNEHFALCNDLGNHVKQHLSDERHVCPRPYGYGPVTITTISLCAHSLTHLTMEKTVRKQENTNASSSNDAHQRNMSI